MLGDGIRPQPGGSRLSHRKSIMCNEDEYLQEVSFEVPMLHRKQKVSFKLGKTIAEAEGCIKVKLATDNESNDFMFRIILRDALDELENAEQVEHRINNEIAVLKLLDHRHIIKLFQVFSTDDIVYMLMERCPKTLKDYIGPSGCPVDTARMWFNQLVQAVAYTHGKGLAHRNISPETALLDSEGATLKLSTYAYATIDGSWNSDGSLSDALEDRPTPSRDSPYAAPELRSGAEPYLGMPCDMYALGATLHTLLAGSPPTAQGAVQDGSIPEAALELIRQLLDPDPSKRCTIRDVETDPWVKALDAPGAAMSGSFRAGDESFGAAVFVTKSPNGQRLARDDVRKSFAKVQSGLQLDVRRSSRASSICDELSPRNELASPVAGRSPRQRLPETLLMLTPPDVALEPLQARSAPDFSLSPTAASKSQGKRMMRQQLNLGEGLFSGPPKVAKPAPPVVDTSVDGAMPVSIDSSEFIASPMMVKRPAPQNGGGAQEQYLRDHGAAALFEAAVAALLRDQPRDPASFLASHFAAPPAATPAGAPPQSDVGVAYLREHGVPALVSTALAALIKERPADLPSFLAEHFRSTHH